MQIVLDILVIVFDLIVASARIQSHSYCSVLLKAYITVTLALLIKTSEAYKKKNKIKLLWLEQTDFVFFFF